MLSDPLSVIPHQHDWFPVGRGMLRRALSAWIGLAVSSSLFHLTHIPSKWSLFPAAGLLVFLFEVIRPPLIRILLPLWILSLGVGILFLNAMLFWAACRPSLGVTVHSVWDALLGSWVIGVVHFILGMVWPGSRSPRPTPPKVPIGQGPVIDI
jgi:putative membrane protein